MSLLLRGGLFCLGLLVWSAAFQTKSMIGCLTGSSVLHSMVKGKSYGDVLLGLFCGTSGRKGIVEFFKISMPLFILFGLLFNT